MFDKLVIPITTMTILGCGITAGILFAFSAFIMNALGRLPISQGILAMQTINIFIINPLFLLVFLGSTLLCLALAGHALFSLQQAGSMWRLLGAGFFVLGVAFVTSMFNVPLNNALEKVNSASVEGAKLWEHYLVVWTHWNHVRTLASIGATVSFIVSCLK